MKTIKLFLILLIGVVNLSANKAHSTQPLIMDKVAVQENLSFGLFQTGMVKSIIMDSNTDLDNSGIKEKIISQRPFRQGIR